MIGKDYFVGPGFVVDKGFGVFAELFVGLAMLVEGDVIHGGLLLGEGKCIPAAAQFFFVADFFVVSVPKIVEVYLRSFGEMDDIRIFVITAFAISTIALARWWPIGGSRAARWWLLCVPNEVLEGLVIIVVTDS